MSKIDLHRQPLWQPLSDSHDIDVMVGISDLNVEEM